MGNPSSKYTNKTQKQTQKPSINSPHGKDTIFPAVCTRASSFCATMDSRKSITSINYHKVLIIGIEHSAGAGVLQHPAMQQHCTVLCDKNK